MSLRPLTGLASGEELKAIYAKKSKTVDDKTISAASKNALALKLAGEEADGWRILRRNKKSIRLAKDKPVERQLEDDVWSLLLRMGFKELNVDRHFSILTGDKTPPRQIDVFAKDDETVVIVECTHSQASGSKSVKSLMTRSEAFVKT